MTSLTNTFIKEGQLNWIMKAADNKVIVYHNGNVIGNFSKLYVQMSWRKAFGYTLPESVLMSGNYAKLNE